LKKDALPQLAVTVVCASPACSPPSRLEIPRYDVGRRQACWRAFTESTVIGTAGDAINRLNIPDMEKVRLINNIPVAYAVTYLIGTPLSYVPARDRPRLMRVNLREEGKKLQARFPARKSRSPAYIPLSDLRGSGVPRDQ